MKNSRLVNGFGMVSNDVIKNPDISLSEKAVYAYLCCHANSKTNELVVSTNRIASECGIAPITVKRILASLQAYDIIQRIRIGRGKVSRTIILK